MNTATPTTPSALSALKITIGQCEGPIAMVDAMEGTEVSGFAQLDRALRPLRDAHTGRGYWKAACVVEVAGIAMHLRVDLKAGEAVNTRETFGDSVSIWIADRFGKRTQAELVELYALRGMMASEVF